MNQLEKFKRTDIDKQQEIYGGAGISGGFFGLLLAFIPTLLESVVTTVGAVKSMSSDEGELKGKDHSVKWKNGSEHDSSKEAPIYNVYGY